MLFRGLKKQPAVNSPWRRLCTQSPFFGGARRASTSETSSAYFQATRPFSRSITGASTAISAEVAQLLNTKNAICFKQPAPAPKLMEPNEENPWQNKWFDFSGNSPDIFSGERPKPRDAEALNTMCDLEEFGLMRTQTKTPSPDNGPAKLRVSAEESGGSQDHSNFIVDSQNQWQRCCTKQGSRFFVNRRTGKAGYIVPHLRWTLETGFDALKVKSRLQMSKLSRWTLLQHSAQSGHS